MIQRSYCERSKSPWYYLCLDPAPNRYEFAHRPQDLNLTYRSLIIGGRSIWIFANCSMFSRRRNVWDIHLWPNDAHCPGSVHCRHGSVFHTQESAGRSSLQRPSNLLWTGDMDDASCPCRLDNNAYLDLVHHLFPPSVSSQMGKRARILNQVKLVDYSSSISETTGSNPLEGSKF
jgi:hypothetical protein